MNGEYYIVHKSVLPDYYEKVVLARRLLSTSAAKDVSEAARMVGISRSTYYKYKDYVFLPSENAACKRAVISMFLNHRRGVLGRVLNCLSDLGGNVLTIMQNPPLLERASVIISLDITGIANGIDHAIAALGQIEGVEQVALMDIE